VLDAVELAITEILSMCRICIGGLIEDNVRQVQFMAYLARFGARCYDRYDPCCTHIVVWSAQDSRIKEAALFKGVYIVPFDWIMDSCLCYKRMNEGKYRIPGVESPTQGKEPIAEPVPERDVSSCASLLTSTSSEQPAEDENEERDDEEETEEESDLEEETKFSIECP
jgi:hypothetical protein